jgi:hypothetical protein
MRLLVLVAGILLLPLIFAYLEAALLAIWFLLRGLHTRRQQTHPASPHSRDVSTHR